MNNYNDYETRMNQIKDSVEKASREAWKFKSQTPRSKFNFKFSKVLISWLQKLTKAPSNSNVKDEVAPIDP